MKEKLVSSCGLQDRASLHSPWTASTRQSGTQVTTKPAQQSFPEGPGESSVRKHIFPCFLHIVMEKEHSPGLVKSWLSGEHPAWFSVLLLLQYFCKEPLWLTGLDSLLGVKGTCSQSETEGLNLDFPNITWSLSNLTKTFPEYMGFANLVARCRLELDHLRPGTASPGSLLHQSAECKSQASPKKGHSDFSTFQWSQALSGSGWGVEYLVNAGVCHQYAGMAIPGPCCSLSSEWKSSLDILPFYQWLWPTQEISQAEQHPSANSACSHYTPVWDPPEPGLKEQIDTEESLPIRQPTDLLCNYPNFQHPFYFQRM